MNLTPCSKLPDICLLQVGAVGALLAVLTRNGMLGDWGLGSNASEDDRRYFSISGIFETCIDGFLVVDRVSQHALQIFQAI